MHRCRQQMRLPHNGPHLHWDVPMKFPFLKEPKLHLLPITPKMSIPVAREFTKS